MSACIVCGSDKWLPLPNPRRDRAMLSDFRVLDVPLDKQVCSVCELVRGRSIAGSASFESGYQLYDHAPGAPRESTRQRAYATWLASQLERPPRLVLDVGCGNGSLLLALRERWPDVELRGVDPSPESVARARDAGIDASCGSAASVAHEPADLVVCVNVIEHVEDPVMFMRSMAALIAPGGTLLLVCPDGGRPWLELLFVDHMWSFTGQHLGRLAAMADLELAGWSLAPASLGSFQLVRLRRAGSVGDVPINVARGLARAKHDYLESWSRLDGDLLDLSGAAPSLACFGIGEAAALLRAYAPEMWRRVKVCVADNPETRGFGGVPVIDYTGGGIDWPVLIGVRPDVQGAVSERLGAAGCSVIRWDHLIAA